MAKLRSAALMTLILAGALPATAQQQPDPLASELTEEVEVRYVIIDALVIDGSGRIVPDLTTEDFELFVDLEPHPISTVDVSCPAGAAEDPKPVPFGEKREAPVAPQVQRRIVLTVDYRNLPQTLRAEVIDRVEAMVRDNIAPGEELMVAAITGRLRVEQPFTTDRDAILRTLDRMRNDPSLWQEPPAPDTEIGYADPYGHQFPFYEALTALVRLMADYEGIKAIVLFSEQPSTGAVFDYDRQFEAVSTAATQSRTAIYPIHARGLTNPSSGTSTSSSTALARLAVESGGRFTEHTNDLSLAYARAQRDLACRYAVGFYDEKPAPGKLHRVSLKIRRAGVQVVHPSFYRFGATEDARESLAATAFTAPRVFISDEVRGRVFPIRPVSRKKWRSAIEIRFAVDVPEAGERTIQFGAKIENDARQAVHRVDRTLTVQPDHAVRAQPVVVLEPVDLAPGTHELFVVVVDPAAERPRTSVVSFEVPPIPRRGLAMAEPVLTREARPGVVVHWGEGLDELKGEPGLLLEALPPGESIDSGPLMAMSQVCYTGKKRPRNPLRIERTTRDREGEIVILEEPEEIGLGGDGPVRCLSVLDELDLESVERGTYRYVLSVRGGREPEPVVRRAAFSLDPLEPAREAAPAPAVVAIAASPTEIEWPEPAAATAAAAAALPENLPPLEEILDQLTRVSEVYAGNALKFTADEVTEVRNYLVAQGGYAPGKMKIVNVYSYYRDDEGTLQDKRFRKSTIKGLQDAESMADVTRILEAAGDPMVETQGHRRPAGVPAFLDRPYSWILLFSRESREHYEYELEGSGEPGRVILRFRPMTGDVTAVDWRGTALVDLDSYQVVRAEGLQIPDYQEEQRMQNMLAAPQDAPVDVDERTFVVRRASTDFDVERHGMRFPGRAEVTILRHRVAGAAGSKKVKTSTAATIVQSYRNYRFYDIDVSTEFLSPRRSVAGSDR